MGIVSREHTSEAPTSTRMPHEDYTVSFLSLLASWLPWEEERISPELGLELHLG